MQDLETNHDSVPEMTQTSLDALQKIIGILQSVDLKERLRLIETTLTFFGMSDRFRKIDAPLDPFLLAKSLEISSKSNHYHPILT